ncbi:MAG: dihydrolipoyllysine-residue succinyltransferase, partial [Bacteroidota bacterium]
LRIVAAEGSTVAVGALVATIESSEFASPTSSSTSAPLSTVPVSEPAPVQLSSVPEPGSTASGTSGSLSAPVSVPAHVSVPAPAPVVQHTTLVTQADKPVQTSTPTGPQRRERMSQLRKTIARRLVAVKNETAMLTTFNEVNMGPLMEMRSRYKDSFKEKYGVGLGFMSLFSKAVCLAMKEFPVINASIDGDELVYHDYVDLSIAVSAPRGLMVPVVRGADRLALHEIEREIARLAAKAREGTLSVDEMVGGTFTITNGGVFGSMLSTPIINAPQSAILGMHNIVERPIAMQGQVVIRPMMYLALSYDHRLIDGKDSVSFLVRVKEYLEDPYRMLIEI